MTSKETDEAAPVLNGLVLAGGRSTRMGTDKSRICWHGKEQWLHIAQMLSHFCAQVYVSCREDQVGTFERTHPVIKDAYKGGGPNGALLSAFQKYSEAAWLVVACDLPILDMETLAFLVRQRDASKIATAFQSPHDGLPEPLVTVWEPKTHQILLSAMDRGHHCPRKALINNDAKIIVPPHPQTLMNVNTPQEFDLASQLLRK